jgi:hypothetical protein
MRCDISESDVQIGPISVECNSLNATNATYVIVTGATSTHRISVSSYDVTLELSNVTLTSDDPLTINDSDVTVILTQSNTIRAKSGSALGCFGSSIDVLSSGSTSSLTASASGDSAALGAGIAAQCDSLTIRNGTYFITSDSGAGIGTSGGIDSSLRTLTVEDGRYSIASVNGSGIGAGYGSSTVASLVIDNGTYGIVSSNAAAIGTSQTPDSRVVNLTIRNGTFSLSGAPGIGSPLPAGVGRLLFHRGREHDRETPLFINCSAPGNDCLSADRIDIEDCPIAAVTATKRFLTGSVEASVSMAGGVPMLYAQFTGVSQNENITGCKLIHIGDVEFGAVSGVCALTMRFQHSAPRIVDFESANRGFMLEPAPAATVPIEFNCTQAAVAGALCWGDNNPDFPTADGEAFFERAFVCSSVQPTAQPTAQPTLQPTLQPTADAGNEKVKAWVVVVGVIGGLVVIGAIGLAVWIWRRRSGTKPVREQLGGAFMIEGVDEKPAPALRHGGTETEPA